MDLYVDIEQKSIIHLLWAIFLDSRDLFSKEVQQGEALPESMLRYTTNFLEVGCIPTDIIAFPVAQLGGEEQIQSRVDVDRERSRSRVELFKPEEVVPHRNTDIHEDISGIADSTMTEFLQTTSESLMNHANLRCDEIRVRGEGACLNYNLLDICNEAKCSYRHTRANSTAEIIKAVKAKLEPAIASYAKEGGGTKRRKWATNS